MADDPDLALPSRIGRHDVIGYIAAGGMAELFLGKDPTTHKPVVIKRMLPHLARQTSFVSMFIDEARIGAMIHHPNLVEHLELGQVGTELFLVMEYLEGENLAGVMRRLIKRGERLDYALAAYIAAEAGLGLHAAHVLTDDRGKPLHVVHRDVSPSNIFVTFRGEVKVLDFGIATAAQRLTQHTATGELKGKLSYMSPEQCRGEALDARSDIFSLGIVLYELSLVKRLFKRENEPLTLNAVCEDPIPLPSSEDPRYPKQLEVICLRALARDRRRRYETAKALHADLVAAMTELGLPSDPRTALAREMQRLFPDRVAEKSALVTHVRAGSELGAIPASDVDEHIDVPGVTRGSSASLDLTDAPTRVDRRHRRSWIVALALLLALGAGGAWYAARDREVAPPSWVALMTSAAPAIAKPPPQPQAPAAPAGVEISVESQPPGNVLVDGTPMGMSPLTLRLHGEHARIEIRRPGYVAVTQELTLDRDQRLVVTLTSQKTANSPAKPKAKRDDGFPRFDEAR